MEAYSEIRGEAGESNATGCASWRLATRSSTILFSIVEKLTIWMSGLRFATTERK
jgi:hypothetical protein